MQACRKKTIPLSYKPDFEENSFPRAGPAENEAKIQGFNGHVHGMLNWVKLHYSALAMLEGNASTNFQTESSFSSFMMVSI